MPRLPGRSDHQRGVVARRPLLVAGGLVLLAACEHGTPPRALPHPPGVPSGSSAAACPSAAPGLTPQYYLHDGPRTIALTIDDGPDPRYTPEVLAILADQGVTATFCMVGRAVEAHPELVRRVVEAGHTLANHTWSHPDDLARMNAEQVDRELSHTSDVMGRAGGGRPVWFRAPGGSFTAEVLATCERLGMQPLAWSVDPHDWKRPGSDRIVTSVLRATRTGSIILNHDGGGDRSQTVDALKVYLPRLRAAGFRFATPTPDPSAPAAPPSHPGCP